MDYKLDNLKIVTAEFLSGTSQQKLPINSTAVILQIAIILILPNNINAKVSSVEL